MAQPHDGRDHVRKGPAGSGAAESPDGGTGVVDIATLLLRRRRLLVGLPLLCMVSAVLFSLLAQREYTVESRFMPESSRASAGRLSGLASQFGFDLGAGLEGGESVDFYAELVESQELLRGAALSQYEVPVDDGRDTLSGDLVALLDIEGDTPDERVRNAVDLLEEQVVARADPGANIVTLRTSAPWPALAVSLNQRLLDLIGEFNLQRRQSRAAEERRFLETRVQEAAAELRQAESALERFLSENRRFAESPQLTFEMGRLQRRVDERQQLHSTLLQAFEQARIDEVRNTPVVTVLDPPRGPAPQTAPRLLVNAALGLFLGGMLALGIIAGGELLRSTRRQNPRGFEELRAAARETVDGLRPSRLFGRSRRAGSEASRGAEPAPGSPGPARGRAAGPVRSDGAAARVAGEAVRD